MKKREQKIRSHYGSYKKRGGGYEKISMLKGLLTSFDVLIITVKYVVSV